MVVVVNEEKPRESVAGYRIGTISRFQRNSSGSFRPPLHTSAPSKGTIVPRLINHIPGRASTTSVAADCLNPDPPREGN